MDQQSPATLAVGPRSIVAIVGPTAAGKSAFAGALARELGAEIVNADAMQLYRGLDIGTDKPAPAERATGPYHCLDLWPVTRAASLKEYQTVARQAVADIWARGRLPLVVGGSALYVRALCDVLEIPPHDERVRALLERELAEVGSEALHDRLRRLDREAADAILPGNGRRIVRALEVVELTGSFQAVLPAARSWARTLRLGVTRPRSDLDERIAARVDRMWRDGLVDETRRLVDGGLLEGRTARAAVGYRQAIQFVRGESTAEQAIGDTVRATRRLARRQERTFRADERVLWLDPADPNLVERARSVVLTWLGRRAAI